MAIISNKIGDFAFKNCGKLKSMKIPSKFTSIGNSAFQNCTSIKDAIIPNSMIFVGNNIFNGCINLTNTTISTSITTIENNSYQNCISLKTITIPNNITLIGESAFENSGLTSIDFPISVEIINASAFKNNQSLASMNIRNDATTINDDCFYNCLSLFSITIPSGVTINGNNTFYNIPQNIKPTPTNAATLYTTEEVINNVFQYFFAKFGNTINYVTGILIVSINNVNYYLSSLTSSTAYVGVSPLASGYVIIQANLFYNNKNYTVNRIGYYAFKNCDKITSVTIPKTINSIGEAAFQYCKLLNAIVIPDAVKIINDYTFNYCESLVSITIPKYVKSIGNYSFQDCRSLNEIIIPYGLTSFGKNSFQNCNSLIYITVPSSINIINEYTFSDCKSLLSIIIPNNATSIGDYAFNNCSSLLTIVIPDSVTEIGTNAFKNIPNNNNNKTNDSSTLYTPEENGFIYNYFFAIYNNNIRYRNVMPIYSMQNISYYKNDSVLNYNGTSFYGTAYAGISPNANGYITVIKNITDNAGNNYDVTSINEAAFQDCDLLISTEIDSGIQTIGDSAFQGCNDLKIIKIPNTVISIGNYAFYDCNSLYSMYIPSSVIQIGTNSESAFLGIPYNKTQQPTTQKNASTLYTSPLNSSNYVYTYFYSYYINKINYVMYPKPVICFKEDTKILTKGGYRPIQELRPGDLIKTIKHGYKAINMIGYREIYNPICEERIKDKLYKCTYSAFPEIFEDLIITGCHSILVDNFKDDDQLEKTKRILGGIYSTDDKWRLPACVDERTVPYEKEGTFTIYHLALDNDDYYMNYGIFANGLVVETCSKRFLKELAQYNLLL